MINWISKRLFHHNTFGAYFEPMIQKFKPNWRAGYYRAQVKSVQLLVADTIALNLRVDKNWPKHQAGQHIELTLEINGKLVTRVFTVASSPIKAEAQQEVRLVIKCQQDGLQTQHLKALSSGTWLNISEPYGEFIIKDSSKPVLMLAAGSGITPFIAMLSDLQEKQGSEPPTHLVYYAKANEHLLVEELKNLAKQMSSFTFELLTRHTHGDVYTRLEQFSEHSLYVCGPTAFYQSVARFANEQGAELYAEHFSLLPLEQADKQEFALSFGDKKLTINNTSPLLNQLLENGEQATYGCRMGICHQCHCTKKSGVVKNIRTGKISDRGEELIQLCVSQPFTDLELEI